VLLKLPFQTFLRTERDLLRPWLFCQKGPKNANQFLDFLGTFVKSSEDLKNLDAKCILGTFVKSSEDLKALFKKSAIKLIDLVAKRDFGNFC
jgi:hypothetical protein